MARSSTARSIVASRSPSIGEKQVIRGWDEGVAGMKVGGKRTLMIPADYGYGNRRAGPIAPGSSLVFDVELLDVQPR